MKNRKGLLRLSCPIQTMLAHLTPTFEVPTLLRSCAVKVTLLSKDVRLAIVKVLAHNLC